MSKPKPRTTLSNPQTDIKPVLHEMVMLAQALRYMKGLPCDESNPKFGLSSTAQIAAATSCRALLHFLFDSENPPAPPPGQDKESPAHRDDIILEDWVKQNKCKPVPANQALKSNIRRFNKYVSHLTMTRTGKGSHDRPSQAIVKATGGKVLNLCAGVIEQCFANGVTKGRTVRQYYDALQHEIAKRKRRP